MKTPVILLLSLAALGWAQGGRGPVNREAPVTNVPFERILGASKEPQNWLTYSGDYTGRRHSALKQITPANAQKLALKWVYQSRSLDKNETTPLVVDGTSPHRIITPSDSLSCMRAAGTLCVAATLKRVENVHQGLLTLSSCST